MHYFYGDKQKPLAVGRAKNSVSTQNTSENRVDCLKVENAAPSSSPLNTI